MEKNEPKITNIVKLFTLLILYEGPKHGYEIIKDTSRKLDKKVSPGQIYPFLNKLKKQGYLEIKKREARGKKIYVLTPKGRKFTNTMLARFGGLIDIAIEPRLTICAHCGCKVYEGGHKEKIKDRMLKFCCCHCAESYKSEH